MQYTIVQKISHRSHHVRMKIDHNGTIIVSTPVRFSQSKVNEFIEQNTTWIEQQLAKIQMKPKFITEKSVTIFGQTYALRAKTSSTLPLGITVIGTECVYNATNPRLTGDEAEKSKSAALNRYLKNSALHYILPRTKTVAQRMDVSYKNVSVRKQKTRWGSCSSEGNLAFNWQLVHFSPPIIDYVIIHELAHRKHMNHSKDFWKLVEKFDPNYVQHRNWLKRNGYTVG